MDVLTEFIKSKKDLKAKSPDGYEYEVEIRLKDVTEEEFSRLPKINNIVIIDEALYSVKGNSNITVREIGSDVFIKEKISSRKIVEINAEIVLSLEQRHYKEKGMALRIKRHKKRGTAIYDGFRIDARRVVSDKKAHYEVELEILDNECQPKLLKRRVESIILPTMSKICRQIAKLVQGLDICNYRFPKPVDITIRDLTKHYSPGGSISLKLDGTQSFLVCYEGSTYDISTKGHERNIVSNIKDHDLLTILDTERVDNVYYAFDIVVLQGTTIAHRSLRERTKAIPQVCMALNRSVGKKLVVAKRHFMLNDFRMFSKYYQILEERVQEKRYDGIIYIHSSSYFDPVMRWKPQKTIDLLCQRSTLMAYNKGECMDSRLKISQDIKEPADNTVSEFRVCSDGTVALLRERRDKLYPNSVTVIERIRKIAREEGDILMVFKGLTVSIMRSYHNDVKRELLKRGDGCLLDVGSGFGGDVAKWNHYRSIVCVEPSRTNIVELNRRLGNNKKVKVIQTKIEHLLKLDKSITTLSCFFCITLVDIAKFVKVADRVFSDKSACTFLCIVMSKHHVVNFLAQREGRKYTCEAYTIKLKDNDSIYIHIHSTIVLDQNENLVDVDELVARFEDIKFKLEKRGRLDENKLWRSKTVILCSYKSVLLCC